jgi:hypothetical protein
MKHAQQTIKDLEGRLQELDTESRKIKSAINCLCDVMGEPPKYDLGEELGHKDTVRPDEYYGRPLATVVNEVLEKNGAAMSLDDLYGQLIAGGCDFTGKNDGIKKRGLAISMGKNQKFHRLPNETWGLSKWYPDAKKAKDNAKKEESETETKSVSSTTSMTTTAIDNEDESDSGIAL